MVEKTATAKWNGSLMEGSGTFSTGSGVITDSAISWASRTNEARGQTSPEELLASAHAACYAMAFSFHLQNNYTAPTSLEVTATVGFGPKPEGGMMVTHSNLAVTGVVPGLDQETFAKAASDAELGCPISAALRGNVLITVEATLAA
jgi:osmotically inducible protein OsmC